MKFMLPSVKDVELSTLNFDQSCAYMNKNYAPNMDSSKYLSELKHIAIRLNHLFHINQN